MNPRGDKKTVRTGGCGLKVCKAVFGIAHGYYNHKNMAFVPNSSNPAYKQNFKGRKGLIWQNKAIKSGKG